jgi:5-methylcytosine-specific restriction protein A
LESLDEATFPCPYLSWKSGGGLEENRQRFEDFNNVIRVHGLGVLPEFSSALSPKPHPRLRQNWADNDGEATMEEGFDWVPFYEELARHLLAYRDRQPELVAILAASEVRGLADQSPKKHSIPLTEIDPLTFIALANKQSPSERAKILSAFKEKFGIRAPVPTQFLGIPSTNARQSWLFPYKFERNAGDVGKLWDLFEAVMSGQPLTDKVMAAAQTVKYAGHAKLTQAIFRAAPTRYFPVDGQTSRYLFRLQIPSQFRSATEYQTICQRVAKNDAKPFYEQSYLAWKQNRDSAPTAEELYQSKVQQKAARAQPIEDKPGGEPIPPLKKTAPSTEGYQRDPRVAGIALANADYKCEIDSSHQTFTAHAGKKPYLEAHHLIPFSNQRFFNVSLDVMANVVALCPNCHRLLHHGTKKEKSKHIRTLLAKRADRLEEKELSISNAELLTFYSGELLEEDA